MTATRALAGKAQTVLGPIAAEELGTTLTHEHLIIDGSGSFVEPSAPGDRLFAHQPVSLENLGWIYYNRNSNLDNLRLSDVQLAIEEVLRVKHAGGSTIVDLSSIGIGRDPLALHRIARQTGLNIIMGSGYYTEQRHPPKLAKQSADEIADEIVRDITVGVGDDRIPAGVIGEIGCSYPLRDGERKVLRATALAQRHTGAAVFVHPGSHENSPFEIIEVLGEAGGNIGRTVICHVDHMLNKISQVYRLAESGCYLGYDHFGRHGPLVLPVGVRDSSSDWERVRSIRHLIERGYLSKILVSQDIGLKMRLVRYGGYGYAHILSYVVPLMRANGIGGEQIHALLVENPRHLLQFECG